MSHEIDTLSLVNQLRNYEPSLVKIIFDYVYIPCSQDCKGKYKYIRALPNPGMTSIGKGAFKNNETLEIVIIDDTVTSIGESAFSRGVEHYCELTNLSSIFIPNSVTNIDNLAFQLCSLLETVSIPKHLEYIITEKDVFPEHTQIIVR